MKRKIFEILRAVLYATISHVIAFFVGRDVFGGVDTILIMTAMVVMMSLLYFAWKPKHLNPWVYWGVVLAGHLLSDVIYMVLVEPRQSQADLLQLSFAFWMMNVAALTLAVCDVFYMLYNRIRTRKRKSSETPDEA